MKDRKGRKGIDEVTAMMIMLIILAIFIIGWFVMVAINEHSSLERYKERMEQAKMEGYDVRLLKL